MKEHERAIKSTKSLLCSILLLNGSLGPWTGQLFWPIHKAPAGSRALRAAKGSPGSTARFTRGKKNRQVHIRRICLGSRPLSSCLHRRNVMKHDEMWGNSTKLPVISAKKSAMIFHVSTFSQLCTLKQGASSSSHPCTTDSTSSTCEPLITSACNGFYYYGLRWINYDELWWGMIKYDESRWIMINQGS